MSKHLERDLERLQKTILKMAGAVEKAIYQATLSLQARDPDRAREVLAGDAEIDRFESDVHDECLKILALHAPVAADLRRVSAILLISTDLERMGDLAVGIAERSLDLGHPVNMVTLDRIGRMTTRTTEMVRQSLDAFMNLDAHAARVVILLDDDVDRDNAAIIADLIDDMKQSSDRVETGMSLFSAVRHLERIADHATNIAEDVVYLVKGELLRHHPEALKVLIPG